MSDIFFSSFYLLFGVVAVYFDFFVFGKITNRSIITLEKKKTLKLSAWQTHNTWRIDQRALDVNKVREKTEQSNTKLV